LTSSQWTVSRSLGYKAWGWQVRVWDIAGNLGPYGRNGVVDGWGHFTIESGTANPPQAPINLSANAVSAFQIDLNWDDMSDNEDGFRIDRKKGTSGTWSHIATREVNTKSYSDTGLECNSWYYYRVQAYNSEGESAYSNEAGSMTHDCVVTPEPDLPDLRIVSLRWSPESVNEGDQVTFSCTVENVGAADATDFGCRLLLDGKGFDLSARTSLAPGESRVVEFTHVWAATLGSHPVAVVADWANNVEESDEKNNEMTRTLGIYRLKIASIQIQNESNIDDAMIAGNYHNSIEVELSDSLGRPVTGATVVADWGFGYWQTLNERSNGLYSWDRSYWGGGLTVYSLEIRAEKSGYEPAAQSLDVPCIAPWWTSIEPVKGWEIRLRATYPYPHVLKIGDSYYFAYEALDIEPSPNQVTFLILDENGQLADQTIYELAAKAAIASKLALGKDELISSLREAADNLDQLAIGVWVGIIAEWLRDLSAKVAGILLSGGMGSATIVTEVTEEMAEEMAEEMVEEMAEETAQEILEALAEEMIGIAAEALVGGLKESVADGFSKSAEDARNAAKALEDYSGVMDYATAKSFYDSYRSCTTKSYLCFRLTELLIEEAALESQLAAVIVNFGSGFTGLPIDMAYDGLQQLLFGVEDVKQAFVMTAEYNSQTFGLWDSSYTTLANDIRSDFNLYEGVQITDVSSLVPLAQAMDSSQIAAQVSVQSEAEGRESEAQIVDMTYDPNVSVETNVDTDRVTLTVTSEAPVGKTIVVNIDASILGISEIGDIVVLYDEHRLNMAADYEDVLNTSDNEAEYLVIAGGHGVQVLISIPHFSTHTIVITRATQESSMLLAIGIGLGVIGILTLLFLIFHRRRGARRSKAS